MKLTELHELLYRFQHKKVYLVGDTIRDINTYCAVRGRGAEDSSTPVLRSLYETVSEGGAACVERNLQVLGAQTAFQTYYGKDYGDPATTKQRFWLDGRWVLQVDTFTKPEDQLRVELYSDLPFQRLEADAVVVADYRHGAITKAVADFLTRNAKYQPFYVASQVSQEESNHAWFASPHTRFVCNDREAFYANQLDNQYVVMTRGSNSTWLTPKGEQRIYKCDTIDVKALDTCGAGDAFLAAFVLSDSLEFANIWAGLSTTVAGANPPTISMLEAWVGEHEHA